MLIEELQAHGCTVEFLERPTSQDPHDQLLLQIRGAVAEYGRMLICDRLRRGRLTHLRAGQLLSWSRAPFGYQLDPDHPRDPACLHLDPAAANLRAYIAGFSDNMREVLEKFGFDATFAKLAEANLPCQVTERFKCPSGRVLVRRFGLDQAPEPRDEDHIDDLPAAGQVGATTDRLSPSAWTSPDSEGRYPRPISPRTAL